MAKQLSLGLEKRLSAKVIVSLSEEQKIQVIDGLKEMLVAALEAMRKGGVKDGEGGD